MLSMQQHILVGDHPRKLLWPTWHSQRANGTMKHHHKSTRPNTNNGCGKRMEPCAATHTPDAQLNSPKAARCRKCLRLGASNHDKPGKTQSTRRHMLLADTPLAAMCAVAAALPVVADSNPNCPRKRLRQFTQTWVQIMMILINDSKWPPPGAPHCTVPFSLRP